ncbi:hypothetical protein K504DRAFT_479595 [Pleomassaria siparia CBS 279.74]|uniref:Zn(2)-C6 fungal-type domain-containing protein n=1 Tax=Pleomassaria siparia CBS 279.74 TaxID=1314801 RepID=A0A6G1KNT8_9PLEO|nr:hypothetical protein K504DRAFT_479595 [Pleomassaria siparia CBS 279.74]
MTHHIKLKPGVFVLEFRSLKKTRRYGAKVKTGCRTCKIRRIKCDEGKPNCARCMSTGRTCDGYDYEMISNPKALAPVQSSSFRNSVPIPMLSEAGDSVLYLEFYHHCARPTLANNFDREFWSRIVLQMAHAEPAVRHAVIALGYLSKTEPGSLRHARSVSMVETRKPLLHHYNKAVRCLVDRMAQPSYSAEIGLVTCLLFICIEFLRSDYHAAFAHLYSGLKIIAEWQQRPKEALESIVTKETVTSSIVANNLMPMFIRAMSSAMLFGAPFEPQLVPFCSRPQDLQAPWFTTIFAAHAALHELRNAALILISILFRTLIAGAQPTTEDLQARIHLLNCHDSWFKALQTIECQGSLSEEDSVAASSLKVSHYTTYLALMGALDIHLTSYDAHTSSFKALNHHAKVVLDSIGTSNTPASTSSSSPSSSGSSDRSLSPSGSYKGAAAHFTFDVTLIPMLYYAATRCRCPVTRRESVALLERELPREAVWDATQHALVAKRVIEIEESELDPKTGWPTQATRLINAGIEDMQPDGGFWVRFIPAACYVNGKFMLNYHRRRGHRVLEVPDSDWEEWFEM